MKIFFYLLLHSVMDLINTFLNLVAPPFAFFFLCLFLPPYLCYKFFIYLLGTVFSENLEGRVIVITGASSGIGEQLAYEYASRGACLALCARRETSLEEVADRACHIGSPGVITIPADVSKVDECRHLIEETVHHFGRLDHLVNNAGIRAVCTFEETDDITNFKYIMDTNFWGSVYTTRFAIPHLRRSKGKIVALSSSASWLPAPRHSFYNASKAAMLSFFETLRVEVGSDVDITIVTSGFIESELTQGKFFTREGKIEVDQDMRDVQTSVVPVASVSCCARAIVNSASRGDRYLTQPSWFRITYWLKVLCPELVEWTYRMCYLCEPGVPPTEAPSEKILDLTGAKRVVCPSTNQSPDIKTE
ncbi:11-beta-hydroxysteroid dehydrogenase A-like [Mangifera indica]|uniref:11-beta-hydroxysteroid dehydrogenase A-like n=1 Tax=Mangifera indica TaxID=29780 RepID=UPI001CFB8DFC|nr:11-beta-hydroxysteroid dehydrogenase A-like [Mangifera indica]